MDLAWISLVALLVVIVASCTTTVNPGVLSIVFAWVIGVYLGPMLGKAIGLKAVMAGFPTELFLTLVGVTAAVRAGPGQRHAGAGRPPGGAVLPGQRRADADHVLRPGAGARLDRGGQHRGGGAGGPDGHGGRRPGGHPGLPDDDHGRPRRRGRRPVAVRADGDHRRRPDGPDGAVRLRVADLRRTTCWPTRSSPSPATSPSAAWRLLGRRDPRTRSPTRRDAGRGRRDRFRWRHGVTLGVIAALIVGVVGFGVHVGMGAFAAAVLLPLAGGGRREGGGPRDALGRDPDGLRRDGADVAAGEDRRDRPVHHAPGRSSPRRSRSPA